MLEVVVRNLPHFRVFDGTFKTLFQTFRVSYLAVLEGLRHEGPIVYLIFVVSKVLEAPAS